MDGIAKIILDNIKLPSEKAELLIPFLTKIKQHYGDPVALVHDMGRGILSAVKAVFKDIPDFICHFHFLRDIGKDLYGKEYAKIRTRLQKHKIRGLLRKKAKALEKLIGDDTQTVCRLLEGIDNGRPPCPLRHSILWSGSFIHAQFFDPYNHLQLQPYRFL